jgi:hypothetical protein
MHQYTGPRTATGIAKTLGVHSQTSHPGIFWEHQLAAPLHSKYIH